MSTTKTEAAVARSVTQQSPDMERDQDSAQAAVLKTTADSAVETSVQPQQADKVSSAETGEAPSPTAGEAPSITAGEAPSTEGGGTKPGGFDLWRGRLGSARLVVAPMVDQSEAAWRMLSRKYGAELCYTPMYHANVFVKDVKYRRECLTTYPEDRPLIIQFCANSPATLLRAARYCSTGQFDALDINLGCPQAIARRGRYGAFLQDEWQLISELVKVVHEQTTLPVTCKIRIFDDLDKTIRYARMLESAGCQLLTVHGRTRDMKGPLTGLADWDAIKAVRESVSIPVFANGNIQYLSDVQRCLERTGVHGVMSAEGNLHNPALFSGGHPPVWEVAEEYLELVRRYPCPLSYSRGHVFKILHYCLLMPANHDVRELAARASRLEQLEEAVALLRERYSRYTEPGAPAWQPEPGPETELVRRLPLSPLLCQPHEREPIESHLLKMQANTDKQRRERQQQREASSEQREASSEQREASSEQREEGAPPPPDAAAPPPSRAQDPTALSKRKRKKLARGVKVGVNRAAMERCEHCCNPRGLRCEFLLCRLHCRNHCYERNLDCTGHRIWVRTKRENARQWHDRQRHVEGEENECQAGAERQNTQKGEMDPSGGGEVEGGDMVKMDPSTGGEVQNRENDGNTGNMDCTAVTDTPEDAAMDSSAAVVS